jgi:hypothetical protein
MQHLLSAYVLDMWLSMSDGFVRARITPSLSSINNDAEGNSSDLIIIVNESQGWNTWCTDDACGAIDLCNEGMCM